MDMSAVLAFRLAKLPDDFQGEVTNHFLTIAAIEYHLRLAKRLLALGDVPSSITFRETIRCDHGEMLRLLAAKAPPTFDQDPRKTVLAEAAGFGSLECMRVLFEMLPLDRLGTLLSGAMNRACNALNTDAIRGLIDLEAEFRPKWAICSDEPSHLLMDSVKDDWLLDVYSSFFFRTRFSAHHGILDKLVDCIRLIVDLGGSPTFALQLVSKVNCKELLCWLVARGGKLDQVPEPGRAKIREMLSGG
ncbi:hypothetical protein DFJ73DRAFT_849499 [Zopfochytrium polystomum]|nr:hypothetical protein DFJ73DRAFT_849499 [Zopfochytrium polystomum]